MESGRRPNPTGRGGIHTYDPSQTAFKSAIVSIVFTTIWLDAVTHLLIVRELGEREFRKHDRDSYEGKLRLLRVDDDDLLSRVSRLREVRRELVHEKAYLDKEMRTAQSEARNANEVRRLVDDYLSAKFGTNDRQSEGGLQGPPALWRRGSRCRASFDVRVTEAYTASRHFERGFVTASCCRPLAYTAHAPDTCASESSPSRCRRRCENG
jgi:hypothetical protein